MPFCCDEGNEAAHRCAGHGRGRVLRDVVLAADVRNELCHQPIDVARTTPARTIFSGPLGRAGCSDQQRARQDAPGTHQRIEDLVHPPVHAKVGRRRVDHVLAVVHDKNPLNGGGRVGLGRGPHPHFTRHQPLSLAAPRGFQALACDLAHHAAGGVGVAPRQHGVLHMHQGPRRSSRRWDVFGLQCPGLRAPTRPRVNLYSRDCGVKGVVPSPTVVAHVGQGQPAWLPRTPRLGASRHAQATNPGTSPGATTVKDNWVFADSVWGSVTCHPEARCTSHESQVVACGESTPRRAPQAGLELPETTCMFPGCQTTPCGSCATQA